MASTASAAHHLRQLCAQSQVVVFSVDSHSSDPYGLPLYYTWDATFREVFHTVSLTFCARFARFTQGITHVLRTFRALRLTISPKRLWLGCSSPITQPCRPMGSQTSHMMWAMSLQPLVHVWRVYGVSPDRYVTISRKFAKSFANSWTRSSEWPFCKHLQHPLHCHLSGYHWQYLWRGWRWRKVPFCGLTPPTVTPTRFARSRNRCVRGWRAVSSSSCTPQGSQTAWA